MFIHMSVYTPRGPPRRPRRRLRRRRRRWEAPREFANTREEIMSQDVCEYEGRNNEFANTREEIMEFAIQCGVKTRKK